MNRPPILVMYPSAAEDLCLYITDHEMMQHVLLAIDSAMEARVCNDVFIGDFVPELTALAVEHDVKHWLI